jgi:elongation factor 1-alpha
MESYLRLKKLFPIQPPENEIDNREYKRNLVCIKKNEIKFFNKRATQMKYRLILGNGKAIYIFGIEDDGFNKGISNIDLIKSINNLLEISKIINATVDNIRIYDGIDGLIATIRISMNISSIDLIY